MRILFRPCSQRVQGASPGDPRTEDDPLGYYQSYAYCFGYINAMIQSIYT